MFKNHKNLEYRRNTSPGNRPAQVDTVNCNRGDYIFPWKSFLSGIFKQKGELWVWLTDDENKIPVQMRSKVAVGSITTELKKIEGVSLPIKSQIK